jgi:hypothetical protein
MAKPTIFKNIIWHLFAGEIPSSCENHCNLLWIRALLYPNLGFQLMPGPDLSINEKKIITVDKKVRQADKIPWQFYNVYFSSNA